MELFTRSQIRAIRRSPLFWKLSEDRIIALSSYFPASADSYYFLRLVEDTPYSTLLHSNFGFTLHIFEANGTSDCAWVGDTEKLDFEDLESAIFFSNIYYSIHAIESIIDTDHDPNLVREHFPYWEIDFYKNTPWS